MFAIPGLFMFLSSGTDEAKLQQELHASSLPKQSRANRSQIAHVWDSGGRTAGNPELVDRLLRGGRGSSQRIQVDNVAAAAATAAAPADASPDAGPAGAAARKKAQLEARIEEIKAIDDYDEKPDLLTELKACRRSLRDLKNNETIAAHNQRRAEAAQKKQKQKKKKKKKPKSASGEVGANPSHGDPEPSTTSSTGTSPPQQEV